MPKLFLFMMVSLDGYFEGPGHDLSWHNVDAEFNEYATMQTKSAGTLLFGRSTYELMRGYWPTEQARHDDPKVAELMNTTPKIVFSKKLTEAAETENWRNIRLMNSIQPEEIRKLKSSSQKDLAIYGSNNLCVEMMKLGLVDEFRIMVNPIAIGQGTPLFAGILSAQKFKLAGSRVFKSGNVLLTYQPG